MAMRVPDDWLRSSVRFSRGATTTEDEIEEAVPCIIHVTQSLFDLHAERVPYKRPKNGLNSAFTSSSPSEKVEIEDSVLAQKNHKSTDTGYKNVTEPGLEELQRACVPKG